uniref:Cell surface protein n=1 Tax=uncultured bacterium contig00093 TaxID=1181564 RepID=A0A806KJ98_9BACT|nr:cell surface protein [uncultured bacterium contig00093]
MLLSKGRTGSTRSNGCNGWKRRTRWAAAVWIIALICAATVNAQWSGTGDGTAGSPWQIGLASNEGGAASVTAVLSGEGADKTITISGTGAMMAFTDVVTSRPWNSEIANIKTIVISDGVTTVGAYAFGSSILANAARNATSLTLPSTLTSIGTFAFSSCRGLTSLTLPEGLTRIGNYAFLDCRGLTSLTLPSTLTSIGTQAFGDCSGLTGTLTIPEGVTSIGSSAFYYCSGLTGSLTIPASVTSIGDYAFSGCSGLTEVIALNPNPVTLSNANAFTNATWTSTRTLIVPNATALAAYKSTEASGNVWRTFGNIVTYSAVTLGATHTGENVTLTATVTGASDGKVPAGTVTFYSDGEELGTEDLDEDGVAVLVKANVGAGDREYKAVYNGEQNYYATSEDELAYDVTHDDQADLAITPVTGKVYGDDPFELSYTGGNGTGAVSYAITAGTDVASVSGSTVTINKAGTFTVSLHKAGDTHYNEKHAEPINITIERKAIDVPSAATNLVYTGAALTGVAGGAGYEVSDGSATDAGDHTATVTPDANHQWSAGENPTAAREVEFSIAKAAAPAIEWPTAAGITYGAALSTSALSGGSTEYGSFAWTAGTTVPTVTNSGYGVTFTPSAATVANYEEIAATEQTVAITVSKAAAPAAPTGLTAVHTTGGEDNGGISGVTSAMEYKLSTAATYTAITGTSVTGLAAGTYQVRVAETANVLAGAVATVTVNASTADTDDTDTDTDADTDTDTDVADNDDGDTDDTDTDVADNDDGDTDDTDTDVADNDDGDTDDTDTDVTDNDDGDNDGGDATAPKYAVTWNTDGGKLSSSAQAEADSGKFITAASVTKAGSRFGGWYLDAEFKTAATFPLKVTEDIELYARWKRAVFSARVSAGPNLLKRSSGEVSFFAEAGTVASGELTVYDASGNVIRKINVSDDNSIATGDRRKVGAWDLKDAKGRAVSEGTYLVKGKVRTADGKSEKVSLKVGVR